MTKYEVVSKRYYKYFKYSRDVAIISLALFLIVTAFNTNNETLNIIGYFLMLLMFATLIESVILYVLYIFTKDK